MKYFAYGSNLCTNRLRERVPSARVYATTILRQHVLRFNKRSVDGSGKCSAFFTGNQKDEIIGVVFEIDAAEKPMLDFAEGPGYNVSNVEVLTTDEDIVKAFSYFARASYMDDSLNPYAWYKAFVIEGAKEHRLPSRYIEELESVNSVADGDRDRAKWNRELLDRLSV